MAKTATFPPQAAIRPPRLRRPGGTRLWRTLKLLLPTVATLFILLLIFWSQSNLEESRFQIGITELSTEDINNMTMLNLRFDGMDREDRPFSITADAAKQNTDLSGVIDLIEPRADITLGDGAWVALMASGGHYDRDGRRLELSGGVNVFHDRGFEITSDAASVDLATGTTSSDQPVTGQGPAGQLSAAGFRVMNDGARILLNGPARLNLFSAGGDAEVEAE
ncbi:MAG: LPS export ABC transporter periplasmic protein LptC [Rhodospirillaceae bacterium]|nr:LPS export ABC transporter periplasmic protein LptC [Rhodospirillaceae bacterium]